MARVRRHRPSALLPLIARASAAYSFESSWLQSPSGKYTPWALADAARVSLACGNEHRKDADDADLFRILDMYVRLEDHFLRDTDEDAPGRWLLRAAGEQMIYQEPAFQDLARYAAIFTQTSGTRQPRCLRPGWEEELLGASLSHYVGIAQLLWASAINCAGWFDPESLKAPGAERICAWFRGGARTLLLRGDEPPFALRAHEAVDAKRRIAAEVASLLTSGETVLLDSGTTCLEIARTLRGRHVTVMPLSLQAIHVLSGAPEPTALLVPGGRPRAGEGALTGPLTLASLSALRFDTAVLGCCGLTAGDGMTAYDLEEAAVKKAVITSARRIIAAADGSKLGRTAHAYVGPSTVVDVLVTDTTAPADETTALENSGTTVRIV